MLFYSRYLSDDPEDLTTELTMMQAYMVHCSGKAIHRKPYLYELPATMTYAQLRTALYRAISSHASLQVWLKYERKLARYVQYLVPLPPLSEWQIPVVALSMHPEMHIITQEHSVLLLEGYPWRVKFMEFEGKRYLYLEFHSICIDDYGIKCFEDTLFRAFSSGYQLPAGNLSSYRLLHNMEIITSKQRLERRESESLSTGKKRSMKMMAIPFELTQEQVALVEQVAHSYQIDLPVVYQLIVEHMLGYRCEGKLYGMIDNWRSTLRNYDEVGCFYYMNAEAVQGLGTMRSRLMALQHQRQKRKEGDFAGRRKRPDLSVVYSFEESLCQHLQEVFADQYCTYEMFIRIRRGQAGTTVRFEYSVEHCSKEQAQQLYFRMISIIELLRQQLLADCAS
ncbi:hypothetical protein ACFP56_11075 [Paenibacillus septentrionalis]|uniref:Condensation domain-containing protein n=1 Tax=Paenibacillus septentrionalis TaxID=429342 RepID=A0ABW1V5S2_9BACL